MTDELLLLMQTDAISYQEYSRRQSKLVDDFYTSRCQQLTTTTTNGEDGR